MKSLKNLLEIHESFIRKNAPNSKFYYFGRGVTNNAILLSEIDIRIRNIRNIRDLFDIRIFLFVLVLVSFWYRFLNFRQYIRYSTHLLGQILYSFRYSYCFPKF